jgi:hypothetical protein
MQEVCELRVREKFAGRLFGPNEGKRLDETIRQVELPVSDPRFKEVGKLNAEIQKVHGDLFFTFWKFKRTYTAKEVEAAELFQLQNCPVFEPPGEECGTLYDDTTECGFCGVGRTQASELKLNLKKVPKNKHIARTIADEWIISQELMEAIEDAKLSGMDFRPVRHMLSSQLDEPMELEKTAAGRELIQRAATIGIEPGSAKFLLWLNRREQSEGLTAAAEAYVNLLRKNDLRSGQIIPRWYQPTITSKPVNIALVTKSGINPFDADSLDKYRCPLGHVFGLALLSELYIDRSTWNACDIGITSQSIGRKAGLIRPRPLILISPRFREMLLTKKVKGISVEIAHLV